VLDVASGQERCVFDPREHAAADGQHSQAERDCRERAGERSSGVTAYAADREVRRLVFMVSGRPFVADLEEGWLDELTVPGEVDDPRLDRAAGGSRTSSPARCVRDSRAGTVSSPRETTPTCSGASPSSSRPREYWSCGHRYRRRAPSRRPTWTSGRHHPVPPDPRPQRPAAIRFPLAGTDNAIVTLLFDVDRRAPRSSDRDAFPHRARALG
jgi:dipeptidyl-peptidase-4